MADSSPARPNVYYGGQAILEGVMIRGPQHMAVAVRHPDGHIIRHSEELSGLYTGRARTIPLIRGSLVLWETLALGMRALMFSSRIAIEGEAEKEVREKAAAAAASGETLSEKDATPVEFPEKVFWGTMVFALAFMLGLFFAAPILISNLLHLVDAGHVLVVLAENIVRILLLVGYLALISLMPDIKRVFQYHGAEHMTIHAYEAGRPLTVEAVRDYPKEHTRCGTSFLLVVVIVSFITFVIFDLLVNEGLMVRIGSRVVLVPVVAAISYEILRLGARYGHLGFVQLLFKPNIGLQALTTKVPDDSQIEVAIASFEATIEAEGLTREAAIPAPVAAEAG